MTQHRLLWLLAASLMTSVPVIASESVDTPPASGSVVQSEEARRASLRNKFEDLLQESVRLRTAAQFESAQKILTQDCERILNELGDSAESLRARLAFYVDELNDIWAQHHVTIADDLLTEKNYPLALEHLKQARLVKTTDYIEKRIQFVEGRIRADQFNEDVALETIYPNYAEDRRNVNTLIGQIKVLMANRQFYEAENLCKEVYRIDNTNEEVARLLTQIWKEIHNVAKEGAFYSQEYLMAEVDNSWFPAFRKRDKVAKTVQPVRAEVSDVAASRFVLDAIKIPNVEFDKVPVTSVVSVLNEDLRSGEIAGNNVLIHCDVTPEKALIIPQVYLRDLQNVSLMKVIDYICMQTDLQYEIKTSNDRTIVRIGEDVGKIEPEPERFVLSTFVKELIQKEREDRASEAEEGAEGDGGSGGLDLNATGTKSSGSKALQKNKMMAEYIKGFLKDRGVQFPAGSSVIYNDRAKEQLSILNTKANLELAKNIIRSLNFGDEGERASMMILIESKFLEVEQMVLEQLGFSWSLTKIVKAAADPTSPGLGEYVTGETTSQIFKADNILNATQTFLSKDPNYSPTQSIFSSTILPNIGPDKNINLNLSIVALNQRNITESLAAPKVTTLNGEPAVLKMTRDEYYPESWDEPRFQNSEIGVTLEPAFPNFADPTQVGISLEVTPTISTLRDDVINLELKPSVSEFKQWSIYTYLVTPPGMNTTQENEVRMPEIYERSYETKVSVYDGQTVVMGGIVSEKTNTIQAKYPLLGDIPLIGRFFRDYRYHSTKANLVIFVTARQMRPTGQAWQSVESSGIHDYSR